MERLKRTQNFTHTKPIRMVFIVGVKNVTEIKVAFAPENHQWLLKYKNLSKGGKFNNYNEQI